jgi:hypothetical protein
VLGPVLAPGERVLGPGPEPVLRQYVVEKLAVIVWGRCAAVMPDALRPLACVAHSLSDVVFQQVLTMYACSDRLTL